MLQPIPFNKPALVGRELEYIAQAVRGGNLGADGDFTRRCGRLLEDRFGIHKILLTGSCTAALEMAALLCNLGPGDEVILPSYTFVSTASAFVRLGVRPVFVDIRPDTLNIDEELIEPALTWSTRAICPVHYAGVGCAMDRIMEIANRYGLSVIEDAAQAVNAAYRGAALGSIGCLAGYSFHETKNYMCGSGGALCINRPELVERAEIIRDKGTNRKQFFRGEVDRYTWVDVGSSYALGELACAFLCAQLERLDAISARRKVSYRFYQEQFQELQAAGQVRLPCIPADCASNDHLFYLLLPDQETRDDLIASLKRAQIHAVFHYVPLHCSPMGKTFGYRPGDLPVTEDVSQRIVRLPLYHEISTEEQMRVVEHVTAFLRSKSRVAQAAVCS
jgi:dTDP-4-amino-4,6-dideoxygalactose transaminase